MNSRSFFGRLGLLTPESPLQTDCGGSIITENDITYAKADRIIQEVDLKDLLEYMRSFKRTEQYAKDTCYFKEQGVDKYDESNLFRGVAYVVIFRYIRDRKILPIPADCDYNNTLEYIFQRLLDRLVTEGHVSAKAGKFDLSYYDLLMRKDESAPLKEPAIHFNPNQVPEAHVCKNGRVVPYQRLLCSNCAGGEGLDLSVADLTKRLNSALAAYHALTVPPPVKTPEQEAFDIAKDLFWLDFNLQFYTDAKGVEGAAELKADLHKRTKDEIIDSILFLRRERERALTDRAYRDMRHNASSFLGSMLGGEPI